MSEDLADRIEALHAKATPGPWVRHNNPKKWVSTLAPVTTEDWNANADNDAAMVIALRNAVPEIITALRPPADVAGLVERLSAGVTLLNHDSPGQQPVYCVVPANQAMRKAANALTALSRRNAELEADYARLREALEWYADPSTWFGSYCGGTAPMNDDVSYVGGEITQGKRARAALEGGTDVEIARIVRDRLREVSFLAKIKQLLCRHSWLRSRYVNIATGENLGELCVKCGAWRP